MKADSFCGGVLLSTTHAQMGCDIVVFNKTYSQWYVWFIRVGADVCVSGGGEQQGGTIVELRKDECIRLPFTT